MPVAAWPSSSSTSRTARVSGRSGHQAFSRQNFNERSTRSLRVERNRLENQALRQVGADLHKGRHLFLCDCQGELSRLDTGASGVGHLGQELARGGRRGGDGRPVIGQFCLPEARQPAGAQQEQRGQD